MGAVNLKGDWRSAITISGELFVMISLVLTVLMLHADSLDTQTQVYTATVYYCREMPISLINICIQ